MEIQGLQNVKTDVQQYEEEGQQITFVTSLHIILRLLPWNTEEYITDKIPLIIVTILKTCTNKASHYLFQLSFLPNSVLVVFSSGLFNNAVSNSGYFQMVEQQFSFELKFELGLR
jgi:hypothetical protein